MEEKIVLLDEKDLDSIVGGAFNQQAVAKLGLEVKTSKSGAQAFVGTIKASSGGLPGSFAGKESSGIISEKSLRDTLSNYDNVTVSVKTTSGDMKTLSKSDLSQLLS